MWKAKTCFVVYETMQRLDKCSIWSERKTEVQILLSSNKSNKCIKCSIEWIRGISFIG